MIMLRRFGNQQIYYFDLKDYDKAEMALLEAAKYNPQDPKYVSFLYQIYKDSEQYEKGISVMDDWLKRTPGDPQAQALRQDLLMKLENKR